MKIALSLLLLTAFGLSYAAQPARHSRTTPVRHERAPNLDVVKPLTKKNLHEAEIARLHEEIKAKTIAYDNDHAIAKSNPKDEKLQAKTIRDAQEIQALQAKVAELEKAH